MAVSSEILILLLILRPIYPITAESGNVITSPHVILQEGEPGRLPCNYSGTASLLFWTKGNTVSEAPVILSSDIPSTGQLSGSGALEGRFNISGFSLLILSVKREDEGRYFCEITDGGTGERSRSHTDVTIARNSGVSVTTLPAIELTKGQEGVIPCFFPQAVSSVYWKKGESREDAVDIIILDQSYGQLSGPGLDSGQFNIKDDFSLLIYNVQKKDSGRYFCEVVSLVTSTRYDNYTDVTVVDPPTFYIGPCEDGIKDDRVCKVNVPSSKKHINVDCSVIGAKGYISITWSVNDTASGILSSMSVRSDNVADLTATIREKVASIPDGSRLMCTADVNNGSYRSQFTVLPISSSSSAISVRYVVGAVIGGLVVIVVVFIIIFVICRRHPDADKKDVKSKQGQDNLFDESLPSWPSTIDLHVRIRGKKGTTYPPITIPQTFETIKNEYPNKVALAVKESINEQAWTEWTYQEYWNDCERVAKALLQRDMEHHQTVGICGSNSPEWVITYMGSIMAGCIAVGLSPEFKVHEFWQVVDKCKPNMIVMEDTDKCRAFAAGRDSRDFPKYLVFYNLQEKGQEDRTTHGYQKVYSWEEFVDTGKGVSDQTLEKTRKKLRPNQCCSITYPPRFSPNWRGCLMSHDNITWLSQQCVAAFNIAETKGRLASYLPLHRVAFQLFDIMVSLSSAGTTYFMRNMDFRSKSLMKFVKLVRPTKFIVIPDKLDTIKEEVKRKEEGYSSVKKELVKWAKCIGLTGSTSKWESKPWGWTLANFLLFRKIRFDLGLNECKCCLSYGNTPRKETLDFFLGIGLPIYNMYGMSESTGVLTTCLPGSVKSGSVGKTFPDSKIVLHNSDTAGNGEVCFYDRSLFMGYHNQKNETTSSLTEQGLFMTGDIGYRDSDGFLYLIGNTKDKITTKEGHTIHPVPIEEAIKKTPVISDCMVIGEKRPFLTLLATLKLKKQKNKQQTQETEALVSDDDVNKEIIEAIHEHNTSVVTDWQQVSVCYLLDEQFSIEKEELSELYKMKNRGIIEEHYRSEIDEMYQTFKTRPAGVHILPIYEQTTSDESETAQLAASEDKF